VRKSYPATTMRWSMFGAGCLVLGTVILLTPSAAAGAQPTTTASDSSIEQTAGSDSMLVDAGSIPATATPEAASAGPTMEVSTDPPAAGPPTSAAASAAAATAPAVTGPQLSIAVDNGKTSTTTGDQLDYVITLQNLGSTDVHGLLVDQSLPTGLQFGTADSGGAADAKGVNWTVDLKATQTATFHTTMTVAATPAELLRLATVACASTSAAGPPIVCASHSDQLPAGAVAEAAKAAMDQPAEPEPGNRLWWYIGGACVLIAAIAAATLLVIRRRSGEQPS